jgi:hypothetical protein
MIKIASKKNKTKKNKLKKTYPCFAAFLYHLKASSGEPAMNFKKRNI